MSPMLWAQLLIINVEFDGGIYFPALFAVLPSKKTSAYTKVFSEVKKALHNLGIGHLLAEQCMADFEMSLRNAWEDIFDYVELKNCRFHFTKVKFHLEFSCNKKMMTILTYLQAIVAKVQLIGLKPFYSDPEFPNVGKVIRGTFALSLVPLSRLEEGYEIIKQTAAKVDKRLKPKINEFLTYFENTWMKGTFKPESWNFFATTGSMTNNPAECKSISMIWCNIRKISRKNLFHKYCIL